MMPVAPEAPISVYVPCRNGASTLRACLEALLSQTYPVAEIIVVDDGSTDRTWPILQDEAKRLNSALPPTFAPSNRATLLPSAAADSTQTSGLKSPPSSSTPSPTFSPS